MSLQPTLVRVGAARIFAWITAPVTGTPPTLMGHTAGIPASGTDMGLTEGDCTFMYKATKTPINAEQSLAAVDVFTSGEACSISFTCKEQNYQALQVAFDNIGSIDDGSKTLFYGGGGTSILTPQQKTFFFSAPRRDNPAKFQIGVIYTAYTSEGFSVGLTKNKEQLFKVTITGLNDISRNAGDGIFQYFTEK